MVTTNVRFSEEDYQKYRLIALKKRISFAELVRQSLSGVEAKKLSEVEILKRRQKAAEEILRMRGFKSNLSIREMIEEGRKY